MSLTLLFIGLLLLLAGGAGLVRGASGIAEQFGVSPLVVGLTVVAFGTSSPELVVNILGALRGESEIAFGNITGSNLANLGLVLGTAALATPIYLQGQVIKRELPLLILGTCVFMVTVSDMLLRGETPTIDRSDGLVLLSLFGIFIYITGMDFYRLQKDPLYTVIQDQTPEKIGQTTSNCLFIITGIAGLTLGGDFTITHGVEIANRLSIPATVVGMVAVAIGTSLPELITSVIAAMRREADLCVGNVIGSNIFNSLFVLPVSAMVQPLSVPEGGILDVLVSLIFTIALIPIFIYGKSILNRGPAIMFIISYIAYILYRILAIE